MPSNLLESYLLIDGKWEDGTQYLNSFQLVRNAMKRPVGNKCLLIKNLR